GEEDKGLEHLLARRLVDEDGVGETDGRRERRHEEHPDDGVEQHLEDLVLREHPDEVLEADPLALTVGEREVDGLDRRVDEADEEQQERGATNAVSCTTSRIFLGVRSAKNSTRPMTAANAASPMKSTPNFSIVAPQKSPRRAAGSTCCTASATCATTGPTPMVRSSSLQCRVDARADWMSFREAVGPQTGVCEPTAVMTC